MATYWVSTLGNDGNLGNGPGTTQAKRTFLAAIPLLTSPGDILNVVADGTYQWTLSTTGTDLPIGSKGTDWTNFGALIRGVVPGSSEAPALATIQALNADGNVARTLIRIQRDSGYLILRNLLFDSTTQTGSAQHKILTFFDNGSPDPGPFWLDGCAMIAAPPGTQPSGSRVIATTPSTPPVGSDFCKVTYSYFQNCRGELLPGTNPMGALQKVMDHCYIYQSWTAAQEPIFGFGNDENANAVLQLTNCTIYMNTATAAWATTGAFDFAPDDAQNVGVVDVYNNVFWADSSHADPDIRFFSCASAATTATKTGTIDYNVLLGGPNVAAGDIDDAFAWYKGPWDAGLDPKTNDTVGFSQVEATVFFAPASTYAWNMLSNGVTVTTAKDLRLILHTTAGLGGALPGALPGAEIDLQVSISVDDVTPATGTTLTYTIVCSNTSLVAATGVTLTALVPPGLVFSLYTTDAGTYSGGSGVWTLGTLVGGATKTLIVYAVVDHEYSDQDITYTVSTLAYTPVTDSDLGDNTDSVTIHTGGREKIIPDYVSVGYLRGPLVETATRGNGIWTTFETTANEAIGAGVHLKEYLFKGHTIRMHQHGPIIGIRIFTGDLSEVDEIRIRWWRRQVDGTYNLTGETENIRSFCVADTLNDFLLNDPVWGPEEGDYYGIQLASNTTGSAANILATTAGTTKNVGYYTTGTVATDNFDWEAATSFGTNYVKVRCLTKAPDVIFIGDSHIAGVIGTGGHRSFIEDRDESTDTADTSLASTIEYGFARVSGSVVRNAGVGGNTTFLIESRFTEDAIDYNPKYIVVGFSGRNDNVGGIPPSTSVANMFSIVSEAVAAGIPIAVMLAAPWGAGNDAESASLDGANQDVAAMMREFFPGFVVIDPRPTIGAERPSGPPGNLWDFDPGCDSGDGLHPSGACYRQMGELIASLVHGEKLVMFT